jgi:hypothetical protein
VAKSYGSHVDFAGGAIECFLGPYDLGGPDDLEDAIVSSIDGVSRTIDVAVQEIDSVPIAEALIRKRLANVSVRVILNHSYLQEATDKDHRPDPALRSIAEWAADASDYKVNRDIYAAFARCGVEVRIDLNPEHYELPLANQVRDPILRALDPVEPARASA